MRRHAQIFPPPPSPSTFSPHDFVEPERKVERETKEEKRKPIYERVKT